MRKTEATDALITKLITLRAVFKSTGHEYDENVLSEAISTAKRYKWLEAHFNAYTHQKIDMGRGEQMISEFTFFVNRLTAWKFGLSETIDSAIAAEEAGTAIDNDEDRSMIPVTSEKETRTLVLLKMQSEDRCVYFILNRQRVHGHENKDDEEFLEYFYNEHVCPSDFIRDCEALVEDGDMDPHGVLEYVRHVHIPAIPPGQVNPDDILKYFPEIKKPVVERA